MPFHACHLAFHMPHQVPFASTPLVPNYLHTPQHTWLIQKFQPFKMDLNWLDPTVEAKSKSNLEPTKAQFLELTHMALKRNQP
jgi:hypothetical protein